MASPITSAPAGPIRAAALRGRPGRQLALVKTGGGTLTLSGTDTYTGGTTVTGWTLQVDGSIAKSAVTVQSGGVLDGTGTTGAVTVQSGGTLAAGDGGAGILATGNLSLQSGATLAVELGGTTVGTGYDEVDVAGTVALNGATLSTTLINSFAGRSGTFEIINNDGNDAVNGTFAGLAEGATVSAGGHLYQISYIGGDGNDITLTAQAAPVVTFNGLSSAATVTTAPDNLYHDVFPPVTITDPGVTNITSAEVTWTVNGSGGIAFGGPGFNSYGITIAAEAGGYLLTGSDTIAHYEDVLSHLEIPVVGCAELDLHRHGQ